MCDRLCFAVESDVRLYADVIFGRAPFLIVRKDFFVAPWSCLDVGVWIFLTIYNFVLDFMYVWWFALDVCALFISLNCVRLSIL